MLGVLEKLTMNAGENIDLIHSLSVIRMFTGEPLFIQR